MTAVVLLFVTGALFLAAEIMLPGGIAGIMGGCALLIGSVLAFTEFGATTGMIATGAALALVGLMLYLELIWLPKTRIGRDMVVNATISGQSQSPVASPEILGRTATALTTLSPSGFVEIAGKQYEAYCQSGHVLRGTALTVVGVDNFRVIVSELK
jgi:membrane-bound ClpP family serine protease